MPERQNDPLGSRPGDKVRIRSGEYKGWRGQITAETDDRLEVMLSSGDVVGFGTEEVTNYSLAARRAWQVMPKRSGRPRSETKKRLVSVRIEPDIWEQLGVAAAKGLIVSREEAINRWLREQVERLFAAQ